MLVSHCCCCFSNKKRSTEEPKPVESTERQKVEFPYKALDHRITICLLSDSLSSTPKSILKQALSRLLHTALEKEEEKQI